MFLKYGIVERTDIVHIVFNIDLLVREAMNKSFLMVYKSIYILVLENYGIRE